VKGFFAFVGLAHWRSRSRTPPAAPFFECRDTRTDQCNINSLPLTPSAWRLQYLTGKAAMKLKANDWIEHETLGLGRVNEDRGDRLDIQFITSGAKTILKTANLRSALAPEDFETSTNKVKSRASRIKAKLAPVG